jgi:fatty acid desaturase
MCGLFEEPESPTDDWWKFGFKFNWWLRMMFGSEPGRIQMGQIAEAVQMGIIFMMVTIVLATWGAWWTFWYVVLSIFETLVSVLFVTIMYEFTIFQTFNDSVLAAFLAGSVTILSPLLAPILSLLGLFGQYLSHSDPLTFNY